MARGTGPLIPRDSGKIIIPAAPALLIPRGYRREIVPTRPRALVYTKFSEIACVDDATASFFAALSRTRRDSDVGRLAFLNNIVIDSPSRSDLHEKLENEYIRPALRAALQKCRSSESDQPPDLFVVFDRGALLLTLKSLFITRETDASDDEHLIGDLVLLANDHVAGLDSEPADDFDLFVKHLAFWELANTKNLLYAAPRYHFLLETIAGDDPTIAAGRKALSLDISAFGGIPLRRYTPFVFALYAIVTRGRLPEGACDIDLTQLPVDAPELPPEYMTKFFDRRSATAAQFADEFGVAHSENAFRNRVKSSSFSTDFTPFRRRPFLRIGESRYLMLDSDFVIELVSDGFYFAIIDGLPDKDARNKFQSQIWGRAFELYVIDLFTHFFPAPETSVITPRWLLSAGEAFEGGQIDAMLDGGNEVIVFEIKASRLRAGTKLSRDGKQIATETRLKFVENEDGDPKGVRQLAKACQAVAMGRVTVAGRAQPRVVYPVLICQERAFEGLGGNKYLNSLFLPFRKESPNCKVRPLTVISIDELEELLPHVASRLEWRDVFEGRFHRDDVNLTSVHQQLYNLLLAAGRTEEKVFNEHLRARFRQVFPDFVPRSERLDSDRGNVQVEVE